MFNVGDVITASANIFVVTGLMGDDRVVISYEGEHHGDYPARLFTLVIPSTPKLTGMTQFFKDIKEKETTT
jgi:hypothetical protein